MVSPLRQATQLTKYFIRARQRELKDVVSLPWWSGVQVLLLVMDPDPDIERYDQICRIKNMDIDIDLSAMRRDEVRKSPF